MSSVPNITKSLAVWLRFLIKHHIAVIMTNQTLKADVERLIEIIEDQTRNFQTLIKVKGKIDMLIGHATQPSTSEVDQ